MEFVHESMIVWLILSSVFAGLLQVISKNRPSEVQPGMATKSDQFSMKTIFLSVRSGEAPLFFCVIGTTVFFFLFSIALSKEIGSLIPMR
ncbi:hypothetical protein KKA14_14340 [bacterium]|nr:hypothetical protein [bacterium]